MLWPSSVDKVLRESLDFQEELPLVPNVEGGEAVAPETPGAEVATQTAPGSAPGSKEVPEKNSRKSDGRWRWRDFLENFWDGDGTFFNGITHGIWIFLCWCWRWSRKKWRGICGLRCAIEDLSVGQYATQCCTNIFWGIVLKGLRADTQSFDLFLLMLVWCCSIWPVSYQPGVCRIHQLGAWNKLMLVMVAPLHLVSFSLLSVQLQLYIADNPCMSIYIQR